MSLLFDEPLIAGLDTDVRVALLHFSPVAGVDSTPTGVPPCSVVETSLI